MTAPVPGDGRSGRTSRRWVRAVAAVVAVVILAVVVVAVVQVAREASRTVPRFPSLVEHPDPRWHGTVAYFARDGCVHLIAASGTGDRPVHCPAPSQDPEQAKRLGKLIGPQLRWRADGRLEITMFRMPMGPKGEWHAGSQQLLDVTTGKIEEVPATELPAAPTEGRDTAVAADGRTATVVAHPDDGRAVLRVEDPDGRSRTVLSAHGPRSYTISSLAWSPDDEWIGADDRRILVVDPAGTATPRVLVTPADTGLGPEYLRYAVTDRTLGG
jgi:hypothetical protein